jgi:AcrR family transcriptional regulator
MAQHLKDEVQENLIAAALAVFAEKGFRGATMASIARTAHISTGNVYRYYGNKEALFHAVVTDPFVEQFAGLLRRKAESLAGIDDLRSLHAASPYRLLSEQLTAFCVEHRLRIVILLAQSRGTRYESFGDEAVQRLSKIAIAHFRAFRPDLCVTDVMRFNLHQIYRNSMNAVVNILKCFDNEIVIRHALEGYTQFHLSGLKGFFA